MTNGTRDTRIADALTPLPGLTSQPGQQPVTSMPRGRLRALPAPQYEAHYNGRRPHHSRQLRPPGQTTLPPTSPRSGSSAGPSSAASSANTSDSLKVQVSVGGGVLEPTGCPWPG
jgi:hypothetical protein